tara:strand:- start:15590 stop:15919 length:330 start_codon:yes stop_codon:yes gene_type:complete
MIRSVSLVAALFLSTTLALPAFAQSASSSPTAANEGPLDNGRYTIMEGEIGDPGLRVTILLDTRYGRTWLLQSGAEGPRWVRAPLITMEQAPTGMSLRPLPVRPATTKK